LSINGNSILSLVHRLAAIAAFGIIASFMIATIVSEFNGDHELIAIVKKSIYFTIPFLVIFMVITVVSGRKLASSYQHNPYVESKAKRMKWIGLNAFIFLIPLAVVLHLFAESGRIDTTFYLLQLVEIVFGIINLYLFVKMFREGKQITSYRHIA